MVLVGICYPEALKFVVVVNIIVVLFAARNNLFDKINKTQIF